MKRAATIGLAMTLVTLSASLFSTPAMAEGLLSDLVKDTLGTAANVVGGVVNGAAGIAGGAVAGAANIVSGTVDATGSVIDASGNVVGRVILSPTTTVVSPGYSTTTHIYTFGTAPTVFGATLDTRVADLRNAINVAEANGKLTSTQAADMRAQLDRIASAYIATRNSNALTFEGSLAVARDLDNFNNSLATTLALQPYTPLVVTSSGSPRILVSSSVIPGATNTVGGVVGTTVGGAGNIVGGVLNGVGNLVGGTVGSVVRGAGGVVTGTTGTVLGTTGTLLGTAAHPVTTTVTSTGEVIDAGGHVIGTIVPGAMDTVVSSNGSSRLIFGTTTNVLSTNIDLRMADMRRLVADYQFSGRLSPIQAAELTANLDTIATRLATARAAGRTISFDDAIAMARDLDAANVKFGTFVGSNPFNPMVVVEQGSPRMMIITKNGVVSQLPGTTVVGTTTSGGATVGLVGMPTTSIAVLPILDQRRLEFDRLITNALANHTLSAGDAAKLTADLNLIGSDIGLAIAAPTYSMDQTITLARRLDDFNTRLANAMTVSALTPLTAVGANNLPILSTPMFNNVVGLQAVQPTIWFNTFSTRRAELDAMIGTGLSGGTITAQQAAELRAELARINGLITSAQTTGGITYTTALPIAMNLDVLGNRIHTYVTSANFVPLISQGRITFIGGLSSPIDELSLRRAELGASIDRERILGRLSVNEAQRLQYELGNIGDRERRLANDGLFTYHDVLTITNDLNRFATKLNNMIANRRATVSVR